MQPTDGHFYTKDEETLWTSFYFSFHFPVMLLWMSLLMSLLPLFFFFGPRWPDHSLSSFFHAHKNTPQFKLVPLLGQYFSTTSSGPHPCLLLFVSSVMLPRFLQELRLYLKNHAGKKPLGIRHRNVAWSAPASNTHHVTPLWDFCLGFLTVFSERECFFCYFWCFLWSPQHLPLKVPLRSSSALFSESVFYWWWCCF